MRESNINKKCKKSAQKRRLMRQKRMYRNAIIISIFFLFIIAIGRIITVDASDNGSKKENMIRYCTSISIESNDTLWAIAQKYNNGEESNSHYINSIKSINNMTSDTLYDGQTLIVYYYSSEVKE